MDAISAAIGKEVSVFIHWTSMWVGAHIVALIKGWKIALACMAFTPFIIIIAAVTMPVSRTEQNRHLLDIKLDCFSPFNSLSAY